MNEYKNKKVRVIIALKTYTNLLKSAKTFMKLAI